MKKIAVFIVAYNAKDTLCKVIDRIPKEVYNKIEEIFVIDDCSPDKTFLVGNNHKKERNLSKLKIYKNKKNLGYGGNQKKGYTYAIKKGFDIVALLHGDGQYAPEMLPQLLEPIEKGEAHMVFGSRMKGDPLKGGMPLYKFIGNKILSFIENALLGLNLSEYHSGYRVYDCHALKKLPLHLCSNDFHFDTDIIIQFKEAGFTIKEKPVPTYYGDEISRVNSLKYGFNVLKSVAEYKIHKLGIKKYSKYEMKL